MTGHSGKLGIVVSGGPAPGINSVISAASIRAILRGVEVVGIRGGFRHLMRGDTSQVHTLTIKTVSRAHFRGGSLLGTSRDNPAADPQALANTVQGLKKLGVDKLITIGGDGTAFKALALERAAGGALRVVHVPKTIDNDLYLPHGADSFGYQTARHIGSELVKNLMIDANTTERWYFCTSMGRNAGHLALGIGKAAAATVTLIPEEFGGKVVPLRRVVDILVGTIINRLCDGRRDGVAMLAEGLMNCIDHNDVEELRTADRDEYGQIRMGEVFQFTPIVKAKVVERLAEFGLEAKITAKDIGYELRGAAPIPYDMEYTRDLGYCAAQYIINGGNAAMVSINNGRFVPISFESMWDKESDSMRVRMVDIFSEYYYIARRYMLRLKKSDFDDASRVQALARTCNVSPKEFRRQFHYLVEDDPLIQMLEQKRASTSPLDEPIFYS